MQFTLTAVLALAAVAIAAPAPRPAGNWDDVHAQADAAVKQLSAKGCSVLKCIVALAPGSVSCAAALLEDGLNPIADAGCFASALNDVANTPASCSSCV